MQQNPSFDTSGMSLVPKEKSSEQPKIISASDQEALDAKYAAPKSPARYVDKPEENITSEPKKDNPDSPNEQPLKVSGSTVSSTVVQEDKPKLNKWQEIDAKVDTLGNKAELFEKMSNKAVIASGAFATMAVSTAVLTGSVAGGAALVPLAASIALPLIVGSGGVAVLAMGAGVLLKILKDRSRNKAYNLAHNKYSDTD